MERGNVIKDLIISESNVWSTPHVIQELRRRELHWDEFLRIYIKDLAFGLSQQEWIENLLDEGNIGLGAELMVITRNEMVFSELLNRQSQQWADMYKYALDEANNYLREQSGEISENELSQFLEMLDLTEKYAEEKAYGDAYDATARAHELLKKIIEERKRSSEETYRQISMRVQEAGMKLMETPADKFPGGSKMLERSRKMHLIANTALINRDFTTAQRVAVWLDAILGGSTVPLREIDQLFSANFTPVAKPLVEELPRPIPEQEISSTKFERDWSDEDDDYLIDNYDVLTNEQLKARFISTFSEIENRMLYLGLTIDRSKRIKLPIRNPYVAGKPIKSDKVFVGRDDVFEFIRDTLGAVTHDEDKNLCALIGHRRTGKTSLLLQLKGKKREILEPRIPVFVDIQGILPLISRLPTPNFFWKMSSFIVDGLAEFDIEVQLPSQNEFEDPTIRFSKFLRDTVRATGNRGIVVMIDEFQAIEPTQSTLNVDIYHMLRHIIQHSSGVDFILSGTMEVERLIREYGAAMFGSAVTKRIDFLEERDARKLIVSPVKNLITYASEAEDLIVKLTACHPYFVQLVCLTLTSYLIERGKSKVFAHDVERIIPQVLERGIHFDELWTTDMQDMEKYLMAIVGELQSAKDNWCTINNIESRLRSEGCMPKDEARLIESIEKLRSRGILKTSEDGKDIRFYVTVFGKWVSSNKPLAIVRRDIQTDAARVNRRIDREPLSS
jgi:type I restriction enzyme M protein